MLKSSALDWTLKSSTLDLMLKSSALDLTLKSSALDFYCKIMCFDHLKSIVKSIIDSKNFLLCSYHLQKYMTIINIIGHEYVQQWSSSLVNVHVNKSKEAHDYGQHQRSVEQCGKHPCEVVIVRQLQPWRDWNGWVYIFCELAKWVEEEQSNVETQESHLNIVVPHNTVRLDEGMGCCCCHDHKYGNDLDKMCGVARGEIREGWEVWSGKGRIGEGLGRDGRCGVAGKGLWRDGWWWTLRNVMVELFITDKVGLGPRIL